MTLRDLPIKRKLTVITMVTSCVALLLACGAFAVYEQNAFRKTMARDLGIIADMFDDNVASGLAFNDRAAVEQTLSSLRAHPHILAACVYDNHGKIAGSYKRADLKHPFQFPPSGKSGQQYTNDRLDSFQDIFLAGEFLGRVYLASDLTELGERVRRYTLIVGGLLLACSLVAFVMASRLQRVISEPIVELAKTAAQVAEKKNYSLRAVKQGNDEVGQLITGFNEMLSEIQARDSALQAAREQLEKRVEERTGELANSISLLNATLDSTADGILAVRLAGGIVCHNSKFVSMWAMPPGLVQRRDHQELIGYLAGLVRHPEQFHQRLKDAQAAPDSESFDLLELNDGRTFERYIKPQRMDGRIVGLVINFRDISERKQAEAELDEAHRQLVDTSRQAGMAEVATGVLHNVGNVLNSVNVSATLVADNLKQSKTGNLVRVMAMMRERAADLGDFLSRDPKGRLLPAYLEQLSGFLVSEQEALIKELESLKKNIEHIKDIVAMQQSYAKVSGVSETVKITDLVEDTLRMNAVSLTRHEVRVVREFDANLPPVMVEKHKILQILVNLIRNAKYACDGTGRSDKQVTVRVSRDRDRVCIAVVDNGIGIPPENLTRIFSHGFTTKKEGHGFGLHSGALAAKEMGGALLVHSEGIGKGATFTLELPLDQNHKPAAR
jgi:PAS domain S-box-containing protein